MARIKGGLSQVAVDTLAGCVDFYYWKGIVVARKWPRWPVRVPHPEEKSVQTIFGYATQMWKWLPEYLKQSYREMAVSSPVTGRDIFTRAYINASRYT